jgi:hypothetical protein
MSKVNDVQDTINQVKPKAINAYIDPVVMPFSSEAKRIDRSNTSKPLWAYAFSGNMGSASR